MDVKNDKDVCNKSEDRFRGEKACVRIEVYVVNDVRMKTELIFSVKKDEVMKLLPDWVVFKNLCHSFNINTQVLRSD